MCNKIIVVAAALLMAGLVAHTIADRPSVSPSFPGADVVNAITPPRVHAQTPEEAGRYLVLAAGCNDCHTPGFAESNGNVPEAKWLTGVPIGWRGPWGTTYASNLRLFIKPFREEDFIKLARTRNSRPPMVWPSLHAMSDEDLGAIYRYIRSLGEAGLEMPPYVPPDQEPKTPFVTLMPQLPAAK